MSGNWWHLNFTGISSAEGSNDILGVKTAVFLHPTPERILHPKAWGLNLVRTRWVPLQKPLGGSRLCSSIKGEPIFNARCESGRPLTVIEFRNSTGIVGVSSSYTKLRHEYLLLLIFLLFYLLNYLVEITPGTILINIIFSHEAETDYSSCKLFSHTSGNIKKYIAVSGFSVTCVISVVSVRCAIALSSAVQCNSHAV